MRLARVRVKGFRCIRDLEVEFNALTALVGSGGVGKSAFLRAIDWCINERPSDPDDLHQGGRGDHADEIVVAITFDQLNQADRDLLGRYGVGDTTTFTRTWRDGGSPKLSGSALVYPGFNDVRAEGNGTKRRKLYQDLFKEAPDLGLPEPMATTVAEADRDMEDFERAHPELCELRSEEANHLFGFTGGPKLRERFDYVLVDATVDAPGAFGVGRDSALSRLLATIGELDEDTQAKVAQLQDETTQRMEKLIGTARDESLKGIAAGITRRVQDYVPAASIELSEELVPLKPPEARPVVRVRDSGGYATDVERQGHGLQRALVIAVLQELADAADQDRDENENGDSRRSLMLAIEEPELYQHPLQARAVAEALDLLSQGSDDGSGRTVQIAYSTHSSHFVRPTLFESLRLFRRGDDGSTWSRAADSAAVSQALIASGMTGDLEDRVRSTLATTLRETVFAHAVLLCEGRTDAALVDALARETRSFERDGIAVAVCWGKSVIPVALAILQQLDIPTFVLFDADAGLERRLERKKNMTDAARQAQLNDVGRKNEQLLELCGEEPQAWPKREVRSTCANLADTLETDIEELWPELYKAKDEVARALGMSQKSEEAYRQAVGQAGPQPDFFASLLAAVRGLVA